MSQDHLQSRRPSTGQTAFSAIIPRAPPLPAPRPLQRARDAASRFLGYPSRPPSPLDEREDSRFAPRSGRADRYAPLGATQNATISHKTGLEINTIAINEEGTHALIAGKDIFKTVKIENGRCAEDLNLRTAIRSTPTHASGQPRHHYSIDVADVAWAKEGPGDFVAAATSSGKIILYDLGHAGLQHAQLHEHFRQVHTVTFNPHKGNLLLSGSQDGTVRLWDLRDVRGKASTIQSKRKFPGQSDGVRDVKWSPTEGLDFAFGTDNGEIQRWDMRNLKAPKVRIPAHILACNAIDWHPDGTHIISASSDKTVRVFDVSGTRHRKPSWEIKAPYPVMNARWRPSCESSIPRDNGARQCTQIVTSYDRDHPEMHIWDFRRPHLAFRVLEPYPSAPTDLLWHSQDLLWTVGREGTFSQTDVHHVPKVIDRRNLQVIAVSAIGELTYVAQTRRQRRVPKPHPGPPMLSKTSSSLSTSPDSNFLSRSWADDSLDHSFLSLEASKRPAHSERHTRSLHINAASLPPTIKLDEILLNRQSFRPHQYACRGHLPSPNNAELVAYAAKEFVSIIPENSSDEVFVKEVEATFQKNALVAETLGDFDLSQSWRIMSLWTSKHLKRRLQQKPNREIANRPSSESRVPATALETLASKLASQHLRSPTTSPASLRPLSNLAHQHLVMPESTSNVPTPLARPITSSKVPMIHQPVLPDLDKGENITLPPSLDPNLPKLTQPMKTSDRSNGVQSITDNRLTAGNLSDLNSLQSTDRHDMVRRWSTQPRVPLNLEPTIPGGMKIPPKLEKHDSADSFKFLEGSTDSRGSSFPASVASVGSKAGDLLVSAHPSRASKDLMSEAEKAKGFHTEIENVSGVFPSMLFNGSGTLAGSLAKDQVNGQDEQLPPEIKPTVQGRDPDASKAGASPEETSHHAVEFEENPEIIHRRSAAFDAYSHSDPHVPDHAHQQQKIAPSVISTQAISAMALNEHPIRVDLNPDERDIDLEEDNPFTILELLQELVQHHTVSQPSPQVASVLLLLIVPLLPRTHPLPVAITHHTVAIYVDYLLNQLSWSPDDIPSVIRDAFSQPLKAGLQPLQVESILSTYHDQLISQQLYDDAAQLRKRAFPAYPAVYEDFLKDNHVSFACGQCQKPLSPQQRQQQRPLRCEHCRIRPQRGCPICWLPHSPYDTLPSRPDGHSPVTDGHEIPRSSLFTACLLCHHTAHAACMREWFGNAGGNGCPAEGCLCDCVAGAWREAKTREVERAAAIAATQSGVREQQGARVKSDEWRARESKAVEYARVALTSTTTTTLGRTSDPGQSRV